jgi:hypothetical protein
MRSCRAAAAQVASLRPAGDIRLLGVAYNADDTSSARAFVRCMTLIPHTQTQAKCDADALGMKRFTAAVPRTVGAARWYQGKKQQPSGSGDGIAPSRVRRIVSKISLIPHITALTRSAT